MRTQKFMMPPDVITTRVDGWVGGPGHVPASVADVIRQHMPPLDNHNYSVANIRARMIARQRAYERLQAKQSMLRRYVTAVR